MFISYRRDDSAGYAGRLLDRLVLRLGRDHVFRDIENIGPGEEFAETIRKRLATCDVLLVIIGPRWLSAVDEQGRNRLENADDLVRMEIKLGLERKIRVIPILLPGTRMPNASELPAALAALSQLNAVEIREAHFDHDATQLIEVIGSKRRGVWLGWMRPIYFFAALTGAALLLAAAVLVWFNAQKRGVPDQARPGSSQTLVPPATALQPVVESMRSTPAPDAAKHTEPEARLSPAEGETALHYAARSGVPSAQIVRLLLSSGAPLNAQDHAGRTALMNGLRSREVTEIFLAHSADAKLHTKEGDTALHYAAGADLAWLIKPLLDLGASINRQNDKGETPLMWATGAIDSVDKSEVAQSLIDNGADVNLADRNGETALMFAAQKGLASAVRVLVREHAKVEMRDKNGETALDIARKHYHSDGNAIVKLLAVGR